jgi:drug/metabolite transporter (DMT)-like permease
MDRRKIEQLTASLAVTLLFFLTIGAILFAADIFFNWDIFPPDVEKFLGFLLVSMLTIIVSSVLVNIMLNLSIIAANSELLAEKSHGKVE